MKFPLKDYQLQIPKKPHQGGFGAVRKFDIHTGIDLYCCPDQEVYAMEDGEVIDIIPFTGINAGSPWWNDTIAVLIKGKSGIILYGEIESSLKRGDLVKEGDIVGKVKTVLKKNKGLPMTMLHIELYSSYSGDAVIWELGESMPNGLLDPTPLLEQVLSSSKI